MKTLILNKEEIKQLINMKDAIHSVEKAYRIYGDNRLEQPPIVSIEAEAHNGELDIKSCYSKEDETISIKSASGYFDNERKHNLPTMLASIMLLDGTTGYPYCIMDGGLVTGYRTGAAGGLSAKLLARPESETVSVIGAGGQAKMQVLAIKEVLDIKTIKIWSRNRDEMKSYKDEVESLIDVNVIICETPEEATLETDIIVTTTPSKSAIIKDEWVRKGTHIIAVGADMPGKQELESALFKRAKIYVDSKDQCLERGETRNAILSKHINEATIDGELCQILMNQVSARTSSADITIFDTTGMGIQDTVLSVELYRLAKEKNLGTELEIF